MKALLVMLAACAAPTPSLEGWAGRWSDGFHGMRIEACDPFLVIGWDDRALLAYVDGDTAKPCLGCSDGWPGSLVLDGELIHADVYQLRFDAQRMGPDDGDPEDCPERL